MKKICISSAFGTGNSLLKMLTFRDKIIDAHGTCHESWNNNSTINNDYIHAVHLYDWPTIVDKFSPDITVWLHINEKNIKQICQRIVVLEFLYARDTDEYIFCWTRNKHNAIAGPDWPPFSTKINDYPTFCLDELCQVAYNRCSIWTQPNDSFTFQIDSDELFGQAEPVTINRWLSEINCELDLQFFETWKCIQQKLFLDYQSLFTWNPGNNNYMNMITPDSNKGVW